MKEKKQIIIDNDGGADDFVAIMYAFLSKKFDVKGITLVAGNTALSNIKENVFKALEMSGVTNEEAKEIGIYLPEKVNEDIVSDGAMGSNGLGDVDYEKTQGYEVDEESAEDILIRTVNENPGEIFWHPNGWTIYSIIKDYVRDKIRADGYVEVNTPFVMPRTLWERSGHWAKYQENMFITESEKRLFALKPMNCPGGMLVYKNSIHSYREFPLRLGELGLVHRHEASGALNGLFRVRNFTQDDAHIFMREDQIESEIVRLLGFIDRMYKVFGLSYTIELSTRPEEKYIGDIAIWDKAEDSLAKACRAAGKEFKLNPGDGAFYGPKLDIHIKDSLGRVWQCGTIQLDFNLPERFDLTYIDKDGEKKRPVMLHRVVYGSIERFIGILIEHYAGAFPTWLAPVQVEIIPVANHVHLETANNLFNEFQLKGFRPHVDDREEKLGYKMREAQMKKIPFSIVLGDNEVANDLVTYRRYGSREQITVTRVEFLELLAKEVAEKRKIEQ